MNTNDNDNSSVPPVQMLIPLCETANDTGVSLAWLHAYCVVTIRPVGGALQLNGRISLGQRYGENLELVRNLAAALNSGAVLAGTTSPMSSASLHACPLTRTMRSRR